MRRSRLCLCPVVALLALACQSDPPEPMAPEVSSVTERSPGRVARTDTVTATAVVTAIDPAQRTVTLRMADGRAETLRLSEEVRNLDRVEKGDEVAVAYLQSVAIQVAPSGGEPGAVVAEEVARAPLGERPAGVAARTLHVTAKIVAIDREDDEVTLESADGERIVVDVRDPQHYEAISVGDLVDISYTEAMAISVEPTASR